MNMTEDLKRRWKTTPDVVRRPVVLIIGVFIILLSGSIGWLPGPGGIPLFLIGIAVLATEFGWANRFKRFILDIVYAVGSWYKEHRIFGTATFTAITLLGLSIMYMLFIVR